MRFGYKVTIPGQVGFTEDPMALALFVRDALRTTLPKDIKIEIEEIL